ncbi:MAG: DUF4468 domain-containing protein [Prevotella sp.]|jgi:flavin reductase (DIM6/NTAB) family NADH-FMN oxidoreductase RutF|nr:DUF4468 domain-containing protein [Prevotella sp.]
MNKYFLLTLCLLIGSVFVKAQKEDSKYLAGAVPEVEGRVSFSKSIKTNNPISDKDLYDLMIKWINDNYKSETTPYNDELVRDILFTNDEKRSVAAYGEELFVFRNNFFIYDRAKMKYQLVLNIEPGVCNAEVRNIKFDYEDLKNEPAEKLITDKYALNKEGDGLHRYYDKFRKRTIDSVAYIFNSIDVYLNGRPAMAAVPVQQGAVDKVQITVSDVPAALEGYKSITADKIPTRLLNEHALVSSGTSGQTNVVPAIWGGAGTLFDKSVAYSSLNTKQYPVKSIDNGDTYTISFYTEIYKDAIKEFESTSGSIADRIKKSGLTPIQTASGATTFSEAWLIIECKKAGSQDDKAREGFNQSYIGEILNIWAK